MEIEVGEYVRTKNGISKVIKKSNNVNDYFNYYDIDKEFDDVNYIREEEIVKHSKEIIDLIEIGDIVNKSEVIEKGMQRNGQKWIYTYQGKFYYEVELEKITILTHEQYQANCYTVERKEKC